MEKNKQLEKDKSINKASAQTLQGIVKCNIKIRYLRNTLFLLHKALWHLY